MLDQTWLAKEEGVIRQEKNDARIIKFMGKLGLWIGFLQRNLGLERLKSITEMLENLS